MKSLALWLYRRLALAFPHEFQMRYGADVIRAGEEAIGTISERHGFLGLIPLLADAALRLPVEYLAEMRRDLNYALRTLAKARGFAAVGIVSLALGIGVAGVTGTQFFSMILKDLPGARDADRLAIVQGVSYPYFERYRDQHDLFAGAAAFKMAVPFNISLQGAAAKAERVFGQVVSPEYFSVIGITPARGRLFDPAVDKPGEAPVVFISDRFWRERMNADPDAVGRAIRVNGQTAEIVGIGPRDFLGVLPFITSEIFVPETAPPSMVPELDGDVVHKNVKAFDVLFRLAPGVSLESAEAGLDSLTRHLDQETLDPARGAKGRRVQLTPGGKILPVPRQMFPVMVGFTALLNGLILAIACMNLANMQLARAAARRREVAIRLSVGASRFRLIRQLLTESILLALAGGAAGLAFTYWACAGLSQMRLPSSIPTRFEMRPDWRLLFITIALALACGIGFGLAPALAATRSDLASTLKEGAVARLRGYRRFGMRNILMVSQVAGSLTLLLIAAFMIIGFQKNNKVDVPFDAHDMLLFSLDPVRDGYSSDRTAALFDNLRTRLKTVAGVRDLVVSEAAPFSPRVGTSVLAAPGEGGAPDQVVRGVVKDIIGANFFAAIDTRMIEGREFNSLDEQIDSASGKNALPAILNQTAARQLFPDADPLGRRVSENGKSYEVVGLVKDLSAPMSQSSNGQMITAVPVIYLPLTRADLASPPPAGMTVIVRMNANQAGGVVQGIRRQIAGIDPNLAIFNLRTLSQDIDQTSSYLRISSMIYAGIGGFGLVLSAIGLAGVTAYSVARRRKEIGIRVALGARKGQVLRLVLREGAALVAAGSVLGLALAFAASRALSALTSILGNAFGVGIGDARLVFGAPLLLAGLAMLACYVPARRSTKIDPLQALREE
ncbi:MAG TPA: ADOP family duplicated permease [Bryobacteraceae bacterium]|jgi:predicted permease|nr:ADOP family duplicated permease [Bryobacteraceae bacterium]